MAGHRADFERARERADRLTAELLKTTVETTAAKDTAARFEGDLAALRSRPRVKTVRRVADVPPMAISARRVA